MVKGKLQNNKKKKSPTLAPNSLNASHCSAIICTNRDRYRIFHAYFILPLGGTRAKRCHLGLQSLTQATSLKLNSFSIQSAPRDDALCMRKATRIDVNACAVPCTASLGRSALFAHCTAHLTFCRGAERIRRHYCAISHR